MHIRKKLCTLLFFTIFTFALQAQSSSVIKILNASHTSYAKDPITGAEQIELTGAVSIEVTREKETVTITASRILYNRETSMLFAEGGVTLLQSSGSEGGENVNANTLLFNTSTMEGVFDNGRIIQTQSDAINLPEDSTLIVSSDKFGQDSEGTVAFKKATLTFCDAEEPHWRIWASRIWLLPGGEFAFANAVLFVGKIPVMYLPAFYYPKDELVFNPTFGIDERKGWFFQTTTYLWGRKPLDSSDTSDDDVGAGLYNFMKSSKLKEQKLEGLVLHNLDEDYTGNTSNYIKIMGDYYSTLGGMAGVQGAWKPEKYITNLDGFLDLGFSNTVFLDSTRNAYVPYSSKGNIYRDDSNFMGISLPFRYAGNFNLSVSSPFTLNLSLPIYSDPYFSEDFLLDRKEYMDWIGFLMNSSSSDDEDSDTSTTVTSFTWTASGSYSIPLPDFVKPYLNTLSITNISSSVVFSSKANTDISSLTNDNWATYTPRRSFYYPSQVTPFSATGKIAGTLFQYPAQSSAKKASPNFPIALEAPKDLSADSAAESAADTNDENDAKEEDSKAEPESEEKAQATVVEENAFALSEEDFPVLDAAPNYTIVTFPSVAYKLSYSATPQYTSQITYESTSLTKPEDFLWENVKSTYFQMKFPFTLSSDFSWRGSLATLTNEILFSPIYQEHPRLEGYTEASELSIKKADYTAQKIELSDSNKLVVKPLLYNSIFKDSNISWTSTIKFFRTEFLGDAENPEWEILTMDINDEDCVTVNTLSATASAKETDSFSQALTFSATLPPQERDFTATLALTFPYLSLSFETGVEENPSDSDSTILVWEKKPFKQTASLALFSNEVKITESFNYELEDDYASALKLAFTWEDLQLSYTMNYTYGYDFAAETGWTVRENKEFLAESASIAYATSGNTYYFWKNRISLAPNLSTSIVVDCIRPTNSYFIFKPALSFKVNKLLNITFSMESRNNVIYRYVQPLFNNDMQLPGETNPFVDLWNSFSFWGNGQFWDPNQTKRKSSGFKLKSLSLSVSHNLHDWLFSTTCSISPRLISNADGTKEYSFEPYMTFSIVWKPLSSMKASVVDNYGTWKFD